MKKETLQLEINESTLQLLDQVRNLTFNHISNNCLYIISEIKNIEMNFFDNNKIRIAENKKKHPQPLHQIVPILENLYSDLYDVNLYVYKAEKEKTIIEIKYYPRSSIDATSRQQLASVETMLHSKVCIPPYASHDYTEPIEKFDIHWQFGTLNHWWRMYW